MERRRVCILHAPGTNRDREAAWACELAGGQPEILRLSQLQTPDALSPFAMIVLPGGFSYGDDLGAGKLFALQLRHKLRDQLDDFIDSGRPVLGICNGFQALIKAGILPGNLPQQTSQRWQQSATLTQNAQARFECRWIRLAPEPSSPCVFTRDLDKPIWCPAAHGEGRFMVKDAALLQQLEEQNLIALRYSAPGSTEAPAYPYNPNGSMAAIAGICNAAGNVLGLMPHPEDHLHDQQHPGRPRDERGALGLELFRNGLRHAASL